MRGSLGPCPGRALGHPALVHRRWPRATGWALLGVALAFGVVRNLPRFAALRST